MKPPHHPSANEVGNLTLAELHSLGGEAVRELLAGFVPLAHASEIAIWVKDPAADQLVGLLETAGPAGEFEMKVTQPLAEGIVSQVYRDQTDHLDQGMWRGKGHSPLVDEQLQQLTMHEMCVPFHLAGHPLGVMSAVQLNDPKHNPPSRWGFDDEDLKTLKLAALALSQAMERALLAKQLGR